MWLPFLALVVACEAHVHLIHKSYFTRPIRNAVSVSADGNYSVSGPCGGALMWGSNTYSPVVEGDNLTLVFGYNGGHQDLNLNMLGVTMVCGRINSDILLKNTTVATNNISYVNASASLTSGYDLWVIIPPIQAGVNGKFCTIAVADRRGWGGCIDVEVLAAGSPTPAPPSALSGISLTGNSTFGFGQCSYDSTNCCCMNGSITVSHIVGASTGTAQVMFATCNATVVGVTTPVMLTQTAPTLAALKGNVTVNGKLLTFQVTASGAIVMTDDSPAPMYCGFQAKSSMTPPPTMAPTMAPTMGASDSSSATSVQVATGALVSLAIAMLF